MSPDTEVSAACEQAVADRISMIAERADMPEEVVLRRVIRLGLMDVSELGDVILSGAGARTPLGEDAEQVDADAPN